MKVQVRAMHTRRKFWRCSAVGGLGVALASGMDDLGFRLGRARLKGMCPPDVSEAVAGFP